jgi:hypothetical protein
MSAGLDGANLGLAGRLEHGTGVTEPNPARVYDVFLGGRDNHPVDRAAARAALAANPRGYLNVWHNRDFVRRAVCHVATYGRVRQFLDVGTGLPTVENVHQTAQRVAPESRVVYVDNDPAILAQSRALLSRGRAGVTDYLEADLRDPGDILGQASATLDFDRPIALVMAAVLHFVEDGIAYDAVKSLVGALPVGSYVVLSHLTADLNPETGMRAAKAYADRGLGFVLRSKDEVSRFFDDSGLEPVDPGIVPAHHWHPDHRPWPLAAREPIEPEAFDPLDGLDWVRFADINDVTDDDINVYAAVARKP